MIELEIAEFAERLDEFVEGDDFVVIKDKGVTLGTYFSQRCATKLAKARVAAEAFVAIDRDLQRRGVDLDRQLTVFGLKQNGELADV